MLSIEEDGDRENHSYDPGRRIDWYTIYHDFVKSWMSQTPWASDSTPAVSQRETRALAPGGRCQKGHCSRVCNWKHWRQPKCFRKKRVCKYTTQANKSNTIAKWMNYSYTQQHTQLTNSSVGKSQKTINKSKTMINTKFGMEVGKRKEVDVGYCSYSPWIVWWLYRCLLYIFKIIYEYVYEWVKQSGSHMD